MVSAKAKLDLGRGFFIEMGFKSAPGVDKASGRFVQTSDRSGCSDVSSVIDKVFKVITRV